MLIEQIIEFELGGRGPKPPITVHELLRVVTFMTKQKSNKQTKLE